MPEREKTVVDEGYVGGDGGPMVVLQASAAAKWQGASDFENSLMNGGKVETDYDVICAIENPGSALLQRYNRDMLVLDDSEWGAYIFPLHSGEVAIVQQFGRSEEPIVAVRRVIQKRPTKSFPMQIKDNSLRLLVGADDGQGGMYSYKDVRVTPGTKRCDVFSSHNETVIVINSMARSSRRK